MSDNTDAGPRLKSIDDALQEIDRLRKREAEMLTAGDRLESQLFEAARERDRLRLTDDERMLIESAADDWHENAKRWRDNDGSVADESERNAATLRGLLERTGSSK